MPEAAFAPSADVHLVEIRETLFFEFLNDDVAGDIAKEGLIDPLADVLWQATDFRRATRAGYDRLGEAGDWEAGRGIGDFETMRLGDFERADWLRCFADFGLVRGVQGPACEV